MVHLLLPDSYVRPRTADGPAVPSFQCANMHVLLDNAIVRRIVGDFSCEFAEMVPDWALRDWLGRCWHLNCGDHHHCSDGKRKEAWSLHRPGKHGHNRRYLPGRCDRWRLRT